MRGPQQYAGTIELPGRTVAVECRVWPARMPRHRGADAVDPMNPGRPAWVDHLRIFENRVEIPQSSFSPQTLDRIRQAIIKASRLPQSPARYRISLLERVPSQFPLEMEA